VQTAHASHLISAHDSSCGRERLLAGNSQPVGTGPCPGVRPGAIVDSKNGLCTFNFLFRGSDGNRYMGTAGHCILATDGERIYRPDQAPVARDAEGTVVGRFAYAVLDDPKDFALIRLLPGTKAKAAMCHFGGPRGINDDSSPDRVVLHFYGNGVGIGREPATQQPVLPARSAVADTMEDPDEVHAAGVAIFGDSGSGVISDDGRAVGALVAIGSGPIFITRLPPQLERAEQMLGITLELQVAPLR
jgi:hypothetical protein